MKYVVSIIVALEIEAPSIEAIDNMGDEITDALQRAVDNGNWEIIENGIEEADDD